MRFFVSDIMVSPKSATTVSGSGNFFTQNTDRPLYDVAAPLAYHLRVRNRALGAQFL